MDAPTRTAPTPSTPMREMQLIKKVLYLAKPLRFTAIKIRPFFTTGRKNRVQMYIYRLQSSRFETR